MNTQTTMPYSSILTWYISVTPSPCDKARLPNVYFPSPSPPPPKLYHIIDTLTAVWLTTGNTVYLHVLLRVQPITPTVDFIMETNNNSRFEVHMCTCVACSYIFYIICVPVLTRKTLKTKLAYHRHFSDQTKSTVRCMM